MDVGLSPSRVVLPNVNDIINSLEGWRKKKANGVDISQVDPTKFEGLTVRVLLGV